MQLHESTFAYLMPTDQQKADMEKLREGSRIYAQLVDTILPDGPDKTFILRSIRTTAMWVNVAATRDADGSPRA